MKNLDNPPPNQNTKKSSEKKEDGYTKKYNHDLTKKDEGN